MRTWATRVARGLDRILVGRGRGMILLYHRVADDPSDPYGLCVSPAHFEEHLQVVRDVGRPISLGAMARAVRDRALPDRSIAVTFDDAYLDVLTAAVPLLRRFEVPATVFVTVGGEGRDREFWWDELERILLQTRRLPDTLELEIDGRLRRWDLGDDADLDTDRSLGEGGWHLLDDGEPTARQAAFRETYHLLRPLSAEARTRAMDGLLARAGGDATDVRASRRAMNPDEVAGMVREGLVDAGAHTVTHPDLPSQAPEQQRLEALRSKEELERWIGSPVDGFAYPYGRYDDAAVTAVREAGFGFACTGDHRVVRPGRDLLLLPRVEVSAGDGDSLAGLIRRFLG